MHIVDRIKHTIGRKVPITVMREVIVGDKALLIIAMGGSLSDTLNITITENMIEIRNIYIPEEYRNKGIMRDLITMCKKENKDIVVCTVMNPILKDYLERESFEVAIEDLLSPMPTMIYRNEGYR